MDFTADDVASYQPSDQSQAKARIIIAKLTEGLGYFNGKAPQQLNTANVAGKYLAGYHFGDGSDVAGEVANFAAAVRKYLVPLGVPFFLVYDWEKSGVSCAVKDAFLEGIKAEFPNVRVLLYCSSSWWKNNDTTNMCGDGLWVAAYPSNGLAGSPNIQWPWVGWQWTDNGIDGCDESVFRFASEQAYVDWLTFKGDYTTETPGVPFWKRAVAGTVIVGSVAGGGYALAPAGTPTNTAQPPASTAPAQPGTEQQAPAPAPQPSPAPSASRLPDVDWLAIGRDLVNDGCGSHYRQGPSSTEGPADHANISDFQRAQGWRGSDADGELGPVTTDRLDHWYLNSVARCTPSHHGHWATVKVWKHTSHGWRYHTVRRWVK